MYFKFLLFVFCLLVQVGYADSPLTNTSFFEACSLHAPVHNILESNKKKRWSAALEKHLLNSREPLFNKLAVINALGWNLKGQRNHRRYFKAIARKYHIRSKLKLAETASAEELISYAYLMAMDQYLQVDTALLWAKSAQALAPNSLCIQLINTLIELQKFQLKHSRATKLPKITIDLKQYDVDLPISSLRYFEPYIDFLHQNSLSQVLSMDRPYCDLSNRLYSVFQEAMNELQGTEGMALLQSLDRAELIGRMGISRNSEGMDRPRMDFVFNHQIEPGQSFHLKVIQSLLEKKQLSLKTSIGPLADTMFFSNNIIVNKVPVAHKFLRLDQGFVLGSNTFFAKVSEQFFSADPAQLLSSFYSKKHQISMLPWYGMGYGFKVSALEIMHWYARLAVPNKSMFSVWESSPQRNILFEPKEKNSMSKEIQQQLLLLMEEQFSYHHQQGESSILGHEFDIPIFPYSSGRRWQGYVGLFPKEEPKYVLYWGMSVPQSTIVNKSFQRLAFRMMGILSDLN